MSGKKACCICLTVFTTLVLIITGVTITILSLVKLDSYEMALQYDRLTCTLGTEVKGQGLYAGNVGITMVRFPSTSTSINFYVGTFNKDIVKCWVNATLQYRVRSEKLLNIIQQFQNHDNFKRILQYNGESVIHEICSLYNITQFKTNRVKFGNDMQAAMTTRFDKLHTDVTGLQVINIQRPLPYEDAVFSKERAKESIVVKKREKPKALIAAGTKLEEARKEADINIEQAERDARIYILRAKAQAQEIINRLSTEGDIYGDLRYLGNMTTEGLLSYLGVRTLSAVSNPIYVSMKGPAQTSYRVP